MLTRNSFVRTLATLRNATGSQKGLELKITESFPISKIPSEKEKIKPNTRENLPP